MGLDSAACLDFCSPRSLLRPQVRMGLSTRRLPWCEVSWCQWWLDVVMKYE